MATIETDWYRPLNELDKYLAAYIESETIEMQRMLTPTEKSPEDVSGDAFDVMATRARLQVLRKTRARLSAIRRQTADDEASRRNAEKLKNVGATGGT